jgi:acetylglutamate kinase
MEEYIQKADVLIEALPYIQSFKGKIVLVKLGGSMLSDEEHLRSTLKDVVFLHSVGIKPVVVHGGGGRITRNMRLAGLEPRFVAGYRVTDDAAMPIVERTLLQEINTELTRTIAEFGAEAQGCSGKDDAMLTVEKFSPVAGEGPSQDAGEPVDIGFVGKVVAVNGKPITGALRNGRLPVIATLGVGNDGLLYNVNADETAAEVAQALRAEKLVFVTDVRGLLRDPGDDNSLISSLDAEIAEKLLREKAITGGMIPKVKAGLKAVRNGVHKTHIIDGRLTHSLLLEIFTDKGIGTQIVQ